MKYLIEVGYKKGFKDAKAQSIKKDIEDLGIKGIDKVHSFQLYLIEANISLKEVYYLGRHLLSDSVVQQISISKNKKKDSSAS